MRRIKVDQRPWRRKNRQLIVVIAIAVIILSPIIASLIGIGVIEFLRRNVNDIMNY
jgi:hypothetical protein